MSQPDGEEGLVILKFWSSGLQGQALQGCSSQAPSPWVLMWLSLCVLVSHNEDAIPMAPPERSHFYALFKDHLSQRPGGGPSGWDSNVGLGHTLSPSTIQLRFSRYSFLPWQKLMPNWNFPKKALGGEEQSTPPRPLN